MNYTKSNYFTIKNVEEVKHVIEEIGFNVIQYKDTNSICIELSSDECTYFDFNAVVIKNNDRIIHINCNEGEFVHINSLKEVYPNLIQISIIDYLQEQLLSNLIRIVTVGVDKEEDNEPYAHVGLISKTKFKLVDLEEIIL